MAYIDAMRKNDNGEAAAAFYDKRRKWLDVICEMPGLSDRAFRIGYWLAKKMNGDNQCCWYTIGQIVKQLDVSKATVIRALAELEDERVIIIVRAHRKPNVYYIRLPFDFG